MPSSEQDSESLAETWGSLSALHRDVLLGLAKVESQDDTEVYAVVGLRAIAPYRGEVNDAIKESRVYYALDRLREEDLVERIDERGRGRQGKRCHVTDRGWELLKRHHSTLGDVLDSS